MNFEFTQENAKKILIFLILIVFVYGAYNNVEITGKDSKEPSVKLFGKKNCKGDALLILGEGRHKKYSVEKKIKKNFKALKSIEICPHTMLIVYVKSGNKDCPSCPVPKVIINGSDETIEKDLFKYLEKSPDDIISIRIMKPTEN